MTLLTRKKLLGILFLTATVTLLPFYLYLNGHSVTSDAHQRERRLLQHSESGRLVARSQFDFHHIVEQWIQPVGQRNYSTRRKERLIEDGHVVREAIEYGDLSDNEDKVDSVNNLNRHLKKPLPSNTSLHNSQTKHLIASSGSNQSVPAVVHGKSRLQLQNNRNISAERMMQQAQQQQKTTEKPPQSSKSGTMAASAKDLDRHSNVSTGKSNSNQIHVQETKSKSVLATSKTSSAEKSSRNRNNSGIAGLSKEDSTDIHGQPSQTLNSSPEISADYKAKQKQPSESTKSNSGNTLKETNSTKAQIKPPAKRSAETTIKLAPDATLTGVKLKDTSIKPHLVYRQQTTKRNDSKSTKNNSGDTLKKTNSMKPQDKTIAEKSAAKTTIKLAPDAAAATGVKSNDAPIKPRVVYRAHTTKRNDSGTKSSRYKSVDTRRQITRYAVFNPDQPIKSNEPEHFVPPLVLKIDKSKSPAAPEPKDIDYDSDPRYARLPESVRKKLVAIRKDRLKKVEFLKAIRTRCEGKKYCLPYIKPDERYRQNDCFYKAIKLEKERGVEINPCHCNMFRSLVKVRGKMVVSNSTHPLVALVSLPGSGNTWVRGLLEQATGYCTGSMWCDPILRGKQFCAEGVRANTLVVKNHDPTIRWLREKLPVNTSEIVNELNKPMFHSAIFIHRDPYDATIAEWNRALGVLVRNASQHNQTVSGIGFYNVTNMKDQHTVTFGKEAFGSNPDWNMTIYLQMKNWDTMITHLLINNTGNRPVLLVKYEDLKRDAVPEVRRMVEFLDMRLSSTVENLLGNGFHTFHRNHTYTFDHYTPEQKLYINSIIKSVDLKLKTHGIDYLHVTKYLRD